MEEKHIVYLGLGSNLGDREEHIRRAVQLIAEQIGTVVRQSALYYSEPWGFQSEHPFVNAVVCVHTTLTPRRLLRATQHIERQLGKRKEHATERNPLTTHPSPLTPHHSPYTTYHDRPIDIDILLYDNITVEEPDLKIPHPLMQERDFVMIPLREVLPDAISPESSPSSRQSS